MKKLHLIPRMLLSGLALCLCAVFTPLQANMIPVQTDLEGYFLATPTGGAYLTFAGKFGGELNREELRKYSEVGVRGCANGSRIFQFTLLITHEGKTKTFNGTTPQLTSDMLSQIRDLAPGDEFHFKDIKAQLPSGGKVDVQARKFVVVS